MRPRLNRSQLLLFKYWTSTPTPDLSRAAMSEAIGVSPINVSVNLSDLVDRGLIEIVRARHNKIVSIKPTFEFKPGSYYVKRAPRVPS